MIHLAVLIVSAWIILCAVGALLWLAGGILKVLFGPPPPDPWGEKAKADAAWAARQDKGARKLPTADERWKALQR